MMSINFGAILFLENRLISRDSLTLRRIAKRGIIWNPIHNWKRKALFKRYENIIHMFVHSCWHLDVSHMHLQTTVRDPAFARLLCCCCWKPYQ